MAIVLNNQEEEKKQQGGQGPVTIGGGQAASVGQEGGTQSPAQGQAAPQVGAVGGAPQAPKTPGQQQAGSSGRFQNLNKFIKANQPGQFGQQFQQKVGQVAQQGKQAVGQARDQFQQDAGKAGSQLQQVGQAVGQAEQNLTGTADEQAFNQATDQLGQGLSAEYQGPQALANQGRLQSQAQQAGDVARAAGSGEGRTALLQKFFAKPSYSAGQGRLDNLLLSSQSGALRNVRQQGRQVGSQLDQASQEAAAQVGGLNQTAMDIQAQAKKAGMDATSGIEGGLKTEAQKFAEEARGLYNQDQMSKALAGQDINIGGMALNDAQKQALVNQGMAAVQGGSLKKEQLDQMMQSGDYSSLLGKTSQAAQGQAGRFNKLSDMLKAGRTLGGGELLNRGSIGLSDEAKMGLESQVDSQGLQGAEEMGYSSEALGTLGRNLVDKAFRGEGGSGGTVEQAALAAWEAQQNQTQGFRGAKVGAPIQPGNKVNPMTGLTGDQAIAKREAEKAAFLKTSADAQRAKGGKKGWAGDEARRQGDAQLAQIKDRSTKEGQEYYQQQLKAARQAALSKLLGA